LGPASLPLISHLQRTLLIMVLFQRFSAVLAQYGTDGVIVSAYAFGVFHLIDPRYGMESLPLL
jgi:hypothetical protein